ncbi:MAG: acyltransferase [Ruminococcaceae bacterium]|nr:acyltransferase [Oscillospiraceae bacterium]
MFEFINYLKFIATLLITNSHFGDIWPVSAMASGGLLGNILFFAVSGFLLFNIKDSFPKWFLKRFLRVYPAMAAFTLFAVVLGEYPLNDFSQAVKLFVYPTNYIFLVWLVVCYIAFYIMSYLDKRNGKFLETSLISVLVIWLLAYVLLYDKTAYSIDNVYEPFILFLYFESMLVGALFRKHKDRYGKFSGVKVFLTVFCIVAYFGSKIAFSRYDFLLKYQIVNQIIILIALVAVFDLFMSLEALFKKMPKVLKVCVRYVSNITLQIYIVQFIIIAHFKKLAFPLNLAVVTLLILVVASILYYIEFYIRKITLRKANIKEKT